MLKRILVPIDGTEHSWRALEYACELVSYTRGSLVVMTVVSGRMKQHIVEFGSDCLYAQMGDEVLDAALGSRGMGVLEGLFRNSVSSVIAENANVPVTIVK